MSDIKNSEIVNIDGFTEKDKSKYKFYCVTIHSTAIKLLAEAIKSFTECVNILLTKDGITIEMVHASKSCLSKITLVGEKFEEFYCPFDFYIGIDLNDLFLTLKSISDDGTLALYVTKEESSKLYVKYCHKGVEIISSVSHKSIPYYELNLDDIPFTHVVKMPVKEFQKNIKDLSGVSEKIRIAVEDGKFIMSTVQSINNDNNISTKISFTSTYEVDIEEIKEDENLDDEYKNLAVKDNYIGKILAGITKSGNISTTVDIMICKQLLVLIYGIGMLGSIKYIIVPMESNEREEEDY